MPTMEAAKRRYGIYGMTFSATASDWAPPSTLLRSVPLGRIQSGSERNLFAHEIGPSARSSHRGRTRTIFQIMPVYFCVSQINSNIDDLIFSLGFYTKLIYWLNMSFAHHNCCCFIFCNRVNYFIEQNLQLARLLTWNFLVVDYCVQ